ncbi:60S ribosomal protein L6 [Macrosteles quadrilineatus]|uniref:60S ribosomal protein L6 n=1 Tax=Macrosteles quadrilineatus TaxID=74068 RepID=UPI0023E1B402|nr:60S ribosomal protein L6 [Macrosteles quadrilineatus]
MPETKVKPKDGKVVRPKPGTIKANGKKSYGNPRNYDLGTGVYRFSRSKMYHKKALWKFMGKKNPKKEKPKKKNFIEKPIGGEKNGGTRKVILTRKTASYPTCDRIRRHPAKKCFKDHKRRLRPALTEGTVCIVLAGVHKGKRVVFLKQLGSGLLLVTGPYKLNGCPLRRINKIYVIATSTKVDVSNLKIPDDINDDYFKRIKNKKPKKEEGDIFVAKKEKYKASEKRKTDQKEVDKQVLGAIKKMKDAKLVRRYLGSMFALHSSQYPHRMKF